MEQITPAWLPSQDGDEGHLAQWMRALDMPDVRSLHRWSCQHYPDFWLRVARELSIVFQKPFEKIVLLDDVESPQWFQGALLNIIDSCFQAPLDKIAIIAKSNHGDIDKISYGELDKLSNRIANTLVSRGYGCKDPIAIIMPMNVMAIAAYLGIIKMGGVAVSIADSFSPPEIKTRLDIAKTKMVITQRFIHWDGKELPLLKKIESISDQIDIFLIEEETLVEHDEFKSVPVSPMTACNILFSSGTTGTPKAIPWNHTTPIKAASDAYFHQDIHPDDILAWPTNLGWMMGPWLIFATFINRACLALYTDSPKNRDFGVFIEKAKVTMLGVVPTLVAAWRHTRCMEGLNWQSIKCFSSTGECSNPDDMRYLMSLAGNKPIIEYCGGTEIGGAYISSTMLEPNYPSLFSTPVMGIDFTLLDGEVALIPPSIGLSTTLLNGDHHEVYYANMPKTADGVVLRRHGDAIKKMGNGYYQMQGRTDDTMNLGGIKTSAVEIERIVNIQPGIAESAAVAVSSHEGPSELILYVVLEKNIEKNALMKMLQHAISRELNPLFKIQDIICVPELPKTASNKIMRRLLRDGY